MEQAAPIRAMALPWMRTLPMALPEHLGEGLDRDLVNKGLQRLIACDGVGAVVMFGSRELGNSRPDSDLDLAVICTEPELSPEQRGERWLAYRKALGSLGCGVDLVLQGQNGAAKLAGSRWHVMKDVTRDGVVLYASF